MKKNNKDKSCEKSEVKKQDPITSKKKLYQGGININFPQEYEEQRSTDIRMKPQPYVKPKK